MADLSKNTKTIQIGFIVGYEAHYHHFEKIWRHLSRALFVVVLISNKIPANIISFLQKEGIKVLDENEFKKSNFILIVAMWAHEEINHKLRNCYYKVRYMIHGLDGYADAINESFNVFLCQGRWQEERVLASKANAVIIRGGYARFDDLLDKVKRQSNRIRILYLPTHSESSLPLFVDKIIELAHEYKIITKPHPDCWSEPRMATALNKLKASNLKIIEESLRSEDYFLDADLILADYGGSTLVGTFFSLPTVLLDGGIQDIEKEAPLEKYLQSVYPFVKKGDNLKSAIENALKRPPIDIRKNFFMLTRNLRANYLPTDFYN